MEKIDKEISRQRLGHERSRLSLSQEEVAEKIGTTAANVSRWELGYTSPNFYYRRQLCELFGKSPQELFPLLNPKPKPPLSVQNEDTSGTPPEQDISTDQIGGEEASHADLHSVFCYNIPLPTPREFYGRREVLIPLLNRLRQRGSISFVGQRRIGKTWLLNYLKFTALTALGPGYHIGYFDATKPICHTAAGFTSSILKALAISPGDNTTPAEHMVMLEEALEERSAKKEVLVLCIDEFDGLCSKQAFDVTILEKLRSLATDYGLRMVVASRKPLIKLVKQLMENSDGSPFSTSSSKLTSCPFVEMRRRLLHRIKVNRPSLLNRSMTTCSALGSRRKGSRNGLPYACS